MSKRAIVCDTTAPLYLGRPDTINPRSLAWVKPVSVSQDAGDQFFPRLENSVEIGPRFKPDSNLFMV